MYHWNRPLYLCPAFYSLRIWWIKNVKQPLWIWHSNIFFAIYWKCQSLCCFFKGLVKFVVIQKTTFKLLQLIFIEIVLALQEDFCMMFLILINTSTPNIIFKIQKVPISEYDLNHTQMCLTMIKFSLRIISLFNITYLNPYIVHFSYHQKAYLNLLIIK